MPVWGKSALGLAAFAVMPVAVLSSQGLTLLFVLIGLGSLIAGGWQGRWPFSPILILWAAVTSFWALAANDALALAGSLAVLFIVVVLLLDRAGRVAAPERVLTGTMLVAGFALASALLAVELIADLPLAKLVRGARPGQDNLELSLLTPALTVLVLMAWPTAHVISHRWKRAVVVVPVVVISLVWLGDSVTAWIAIGAGLAAFGLVAAFGKRGAGIRRGFVCPGRAPRGSSGNP